MMNLKIEKTRDQKENYIKKKKKKWKIGKKK